MNKSQRRRKKRSEKDYTDRNVLLYLQKLTKEKK